AEDHSENRAENQRARREFPQMRFGGDIRLEDGSGWTGRDLNNGLSSHAVRSCSCDALRLPLCTWQSNLHFHNTVAADVSPMKQFHTKGRENSGNRACFPLSWGRGLGWASVSPVPFFGVGGSDSKQWKLHLLPLPVTRLMASHVFHSSLLAGHKSTRTKFYRICDKILYGLICGRREDLNGT